MKSEIRNPKSEPVSLAAKLLTFGLVGMMGMMGPMARGQLTATVQPGYIFAPGERPTTDTLNALGLPTIAIAGTISGTVGLSAGTVTGTHLANSVPDGTSINFNTASPRQLRIVPASGGSGGGVTKDNFNSTALGSGLAGGSGTVLYVTNVPVGQISVADGKLLGGTTGNVGQNVTVGTGLTLSSGTLVVQNYASLGTSKFASTEQTLPSAAGSGVTVSHSLSGTPQSVRWVLVCQTGGDLGYSAGDEVGLEQAVLASFAPAVTTWTSSTQSGLIAGANATSWFIRHKTAGTLSTSIDSAKWKAKCYAVAFP